MAIEKIQYAFYFDQTRCMSCNSCTVACKDLNQVEPGPVAWRKQFTYEKDGGFFPLSMGCNHCEEPACKNVCPYNAIIKTDDGIVYVNRDLCQGALSCISACPFAKPQIALDKQEPKSNALPTQLATHAGFSPLSSLSLHISHFCIGC